MISDDVAFVHHAPDEIRARLQIVAYDKEGGRSVMLFQSIQNRRRAAVFKAAVEGQVNPFFLCFFYVIGVILGEIGGGGVGHGRLSFLLEA